MAYPENKKIPWFMIPYYITRSGFSFMGGGISLNTIITTDTVPVEVKDTKQLNYYEQQIPGGYTSIYKYGSSGARKLSFTLEVADFNDDVGLGLKLAQFDMLRRPEINIVTTVPTIETVTVTDYAGQEVGSNPVEKTELGFSRYKPFYSNPYVVYYNSIFNNTPLPFQVLRCDFTTSKPNRLGRPQYAVIDFELAQMEDHPLSATEDKFKKALAMVGAAGQSIPNLLRNANSGKKMFNIYKNKTSKLGF